jgi:hypothetical protein
VITVAQALNRARTQLGVKSGDPEFPDETLLASLVASVAELHQELRGIAEEQLEQTTTLIADGGTGHLYTLSSQTAPIAVAGILACRLDDRRGMMLDQCSNTQLDSYLGARYSLTGAPGAQVIETSVSVRSGAPLFLRYHVAPPALTLDSTIPAWLPDHSLDLLGLLVAQQSFPQGGEQSFPRDQAERLVSRREDLWDYWAAFNTSPRMREETSAGIAPFVL